MKITTWIFFLFFFPTLSVLADFDDEEPLPPEQAFQLKAYARDAHTVRAEWRIAEGYYLYRDKFQFSTETPGYVLGEPDYPKGKLKKDEFFGEVESYRNKVVIDIPVTRAADAPENLVLTTVSQGCADIGLCYPPQTVTVEFVMPPADEPIVIPHAAAPASSAGEEGFLARLGRKLGFGGGDDEFLPVDKAFAFSAEVIDGNTLLASWDIADGYYLYQSRFDFALRDAEGLSLGEARFPPGGKEKFDEFFGQMVVYYEQAAIQLPVIRQDSAPREIILEVHYQGCAEAGFCYPPEKREVSLSLPAGVVGAAPLPVAADGGTVMSEQDSIAAGLADSSLWLILLTFYGFGLLLAFTPCVFPMIPILSGIIVGQGKQVGTRQAFMISLVYVLAMAVTYTTAGVIAGLFGQNLQAAFQDPWILSFFALVFVLLALSMFGFYELQLPSSWQSKLVEISNSQKGGTLAGAGVMGFLSALIVGPCVAAPLAGALIYIGQTGDAVLGGAALFAMSLGMGTPLLIVGTSAGKLLPKAGVWMEPIKAVFGVLLLAVAIWMLERILPAPLILALWAILLIVSAIYMGALDQLPPGSSGWFRLWKGTGLVMLLYGAILLLGAASGGDDPLNPLRNLTLAAPGGAQAQKKLDFKPVKGIEGLERELQRAAAQGKPVMLDFYADWCISCKEMERYTFSDPAVQAALSKGVLLKADVTANDEADKALLKKFRLIGPPAMLFFDEQGQEQRALRLVGFMEADAFRAHVERAFQ